MEDDSGAKENDYCKKKMIEEEEEEEEEEEMETGTETEMQLKNIDWIFDDAEFKSKIPGKFNRNWRFVVSDECLGLSFSTLLTAFQQRYGINEGLGAPSVEGVNDLNEGERALTSVECLNTLARFGGGNTNISPLDPHSIEEILARLPLPSLMRAKSVCKSWNTAIGAMTNVNVQSYHLVAHHIANGYHGIVFFSSALNRWFRIPLQWKRWKWILNYSRDQCSPGLGLTAAGGGLFLFVDWSSGNYFTPVVFNPLTKQHRVLPNFPVCPGMAIELIAEFDHFKVIIIASNGVEPSKVSSLVYNSSTNEWTTAITISCISNSHPWTSTVHKGVVYCTSSYGLHLGCYDMARAEFKIMEIEGGLPTLVDCLDYDKNFHATLPSLVVCKGKLILVARLQRRAGERSILGRLPLTKHTLVGLWELDISTQNKSWSLVSVTPRGLLEDTVKSSDGTDFQVAALDNMNQIWLILKRSSNMLTFDMSSMEWTVLPGCPTEDMMDTTPRRAFITPLKSSPRF